MLIPHEPSLISTKPMPDQATREAECTTYLERLPQHSQDPAFRQIETVPLDEEAILIRSEPACYTACLNPFLAEAIERWRNEVMTQSFDRVASPPRPPDSSPFDGYHRQPFTTHVSEGKNEPIYNARSYHTKGPSKAGMCYILQWGFSVLLSAKFYKGLKQRFCEKDGMYFLPSQLAGHDQCHVWASRLEQWALFVSNEKSALQWSQREFDPETGSDPQTFQDLQPKFLRELHQARHEKLPELRHLLEENFLQDEQERWFIPNPERQEHLEQLQEKSLLREFQEYAAIGASSRSPRLKVFRIEAVRAGFKRAWADKNYGLIVQMAQCLPESVLQKDPDLLMYYDNALMRVEKEPRQGSFEF